MKMIGCNSSYFWFCQEQHDISTGNGLVCQNFFPCIFYVSNYCIKHTYYKIWLNANKKELRTCILLCISCIYIYVCVVVIYECYAIQGRARNRWCVSTLSY